MRRKVHRLLYCGRQVNCRRQRAGEEAERRPNAKRMQIHTADEIQICIVCSRLTNYQKTLQRDTSTRGSTLLSPVSFYAMVIMLISVKYATDSSNDIALKFGTSFPLLKWVLKLSAHRVAPIVVAMSVDLALALRSSACATPYIPNSIPNLGFPPAVPVPVYPISLGHPTRSLGGMYHASIVVPPPVSPTAADTILLRLLSLPHNLCTSLCPLSPQI